MFLRVLLWLLLLAAGWWFFRSRDKAPPPIDRAGPADRRQVAAPEAMVDCARCGLHLPASEALRDDAARAYCCAAHRAAGPRA